MNNKEWWYEDRNGVTVIRFRHFEKYPDFEYFITTRNSGFSSGVVSSFNIGYQESDVPENVLGNRKLLADSFTIPVGLFVFARQTHGNQIKIVEDSDKEKGLYSKENAIPDTDGFIVSQPGICPVIMIADCVPVIIYDPVKNVAGVFHAGWRGTVKLIAQKGLIKLVTEFGTNPSDVLVSVGPSIGPYCYEVGGEVIRAVENVFPGKINNLLIDKGKMKPHFDLWLANKVQLLQVGVKEKNIIICDACTYHHPEHFYSSRYSGGITGRMGAGVFIKN